MKLKVLHITARADLGGGPRHIQYLIENIKNDIECYVACPDQKPFFEIYSEVLGNQRIATIPFRAFNMKAFLNLRRFVKSNGIHIIHCHGKGAATFGKLLKFSLFNVKLLYTPHGIHVSSYSENQKKLYRLYENVSDWLFDHMIFVSESEAEQAKSEKLFSNVKFSIIPNGVPEISVSTKLDVNALKNSIFQDPTKRVILSLSRFDYQKNMLEALEIAKLLPQYNFLWLGNGPDFDMIKDKISEHQINNVYMVGPKDNVRDYLFIADVYLSTSRWEGMPLALLEALSAGLPIVATKVVGNLDVVSEEVGYLYTLNNVVDGSDGIKRVLNSGLAGEKTKIYFKNNFSAEVMGKKVLEVYNHMIDEN
jgi:glycosyltransferase involved in cell wall biosynthesis